MEQRIFLAQRLVLASNANLELQFQSHKLGHTTSAIAFASSPCVFNVTYYLLELRQSEGPLQPAGTTHTFLPRVRLQSSTMIKRKTFSAFLPSLLRPSTSTTPAYICAPCRRSLHKDHQPRNVPAPTPFVPDVSTFLTLIGRNLSQHASKFNSWQELFTMSSAQLKERGIEPPRTRRYLLRWREKFRQGEFGIGGDFKYVQDGVGELRLVEVPTLAKDGSNAGAVSTSLTPGWTKLILNVPNGSTSYQLEDGQTTADLKKPRGFRLVNGHVIVGSYAQAMKDTNGRGAMLKVQEGMWEDKRGHKVHGGERRRAETLHKMRIAERRKNER